MKTAILSALAGSLIAVTALSGGALAQSGPIKIGVVTPLSGTYTPIGQQVRWGLELAAKEINAAGGVAGRQIALVHDRRRKTRLGKDHYASGGLDEVRASARSDHQEKGILHLAMQPDDGRQPAEDLMLAALANGGGRCGARDERLVHDVLPVREEPLPSAADDLSFSA